MATATIEKPKAREDAPKPRVIDPSSRVNPGYDEIEMHRRFVGFNFKNPPKTMGRAESDYPVEKELGWKRFECRGVDAIVTPDGFRVRETVWPVLYILAPDREMADATYRSSVASEMNSARRKKEHLDVVINELPD